MRGPWLLQWSAAMLQAMLAMSLARRDRAFTALKAIVQVGKVLPLTKEKEEEESKGGGGGSEIPLEVSAARLSLPARALSIRVAFLLLAALLQTYRRRGRGEHVSFCRSDFMCVARHAAMLRRTCLRLVKIWSRCLPSWS